MTLPGGKRWIDALGAPLFISWQMTRDCDLACLHCCTDSAPGKHLADELSADEARALVADIAATGVPYVMLCGGEPLRVPHFFAVAESLGHAGVELKIETNGQEFDAGCAARLARLPIRSIQISLDADTQDVYARQRPGASLTRAHNACRAVRDAGLPLEITFAPTRLNIHQVEAVIARARAFGAFRFNTGALMRIGRAARLWHRLDPSAESYHRFRQILQQHAAMIDPKMQICHDPFSIEAGLQQTRGSPPATLLVLPNGQVKVAAPLAYICADLRRVSLSQAWGNYRDAWDPPAVIAEINRGMCGNARHVNANSWTPLPNGGVATCQT